MGNLNLCDCKNNIFSIKQESNLKRESFNSEQYSSRNNREMLKGIKNNIELNSTSKINLNEIIKINAVNKIIKQYRLYKNKQSENNNNNIYNNNNFSYKQSKDNTKNEYSENNLYNSSLNNNSNFSSNKNLANSLKNIPNLNLKNNINNSSYNNNNSNNNNLNNNNIQLNNNPLENINKEMISLTTSSKIKNNFSNHTTSYIGSKLNNLKDGFGIQKWSNGAKYIGYYKNDKAHGLGKFLTSDDTYEGEFLNDAACGFGIY